MSLGDAGPRRRRRWVPLALLVAFVVVPLVEIYVLVQVGQVVGVGWTILLLIALSALGAWLVRREGARAWRALRLTLQRGTDAGAGAGRRGADPDRRHPAADARASSPTRSAPC